MCPPVYPHDEITPLYPGVYLLHGSIKMGPGIRMNRNMIILKNGPELSLINPVRMNEGGLSRLEALGEVKNILRLGDFHGLDDAFYRDRYQCEFWAQRGQKTYREPRPTQEIRAGSKTPYPKSEFFTFETAKHPEAALLLKEHRLLITTDSVQYHAGWSYFTWPTKLAFRLVGFKPGINIGPPWLKLVTPKGGTLRYDFEQLMALDFDALVAAHGVLLSSGAKALLRSEVERIFG